MTPKIINTSLGNIHLQINEIQGTLPVLLLHGVYFDHTLWNDQVSRIKKHQTVITLDMPLHGKSKNISKKNWTLEDCADTLLEVLDALHIEKVVAVGHSWGSMTILRAAHKAPHRFQSVGFCNMPFQAASKTTRLKFKLQHGLLFFRAFYTRQVAKALFGKKHLHQNPELLQHLERTMGNLTQKEIKQTDNSVILYADDAEPLIKSLQVPAIALKGQEDYVPLSAYLDTQIVEGGHISPLEVPQAVYHFIQKVIEWRQLQAPSMAK